MKTISIAIPVFRNEGSLRPTYEQIKALFDGPLKAYDYEFVFVDDGSDDASLDILLDLRKNDPKVQVYKLSRNHGQRSAVLCALEHVSGDAVVKMSADLQEPIDHIPNMVESWQAGNEVVICFRNEREDGLVDQMFSNLFYGLVRMSNPNIPKGGFDFFLLSNRSLEQFRKIQYRNRFVQGDVLSLGFATSYLPYKRRKRTHGKSQQTISKRVNIFVDGLLNSSYLPIRAMSFMGVLLSIGSVIAVIVLVYNKISSGNSATGWASTMVTILFVGGIIMLMLGIIGEYVWRINDELKRRPMYFVEEEYTDKKDKEVGNE